jgi:plastocyanin
MSASRRALPSEAGTLARIAAAVAVVFVCAVGARSDRRSAGETAVTGAIAVGGAARDAIDRSNVVAWLRPIGGDSVPRPGEGGAVRPRFKIVQQNKRFEPHLLVVPVGSTVDFPNLDPFFHNVFSLFEGKRFDLGLYESGTTRFVQFDKPGISFIFCNIHAEMSAVVVALATPYYAISDARGDISIPNVPPGRYDLQVFHAAIDPGSLRALNKRITVTSGETSLGSFSLVETDVTVAHKNKYGRDYDRPAPDSPAYARP